MFKSQQGGRGMISRSTKLRKYLNIELKQRENEGNLSIENVHNSYFSSNTRSSEREIKLNNFKNVITTAQKTHYVSATKANYLILFR